jgi:hypothetical protein
VAVLLFTELICLIFPSFLYFIFSIFYYFFGLYKAKINTDFSVSASFGYFLQKKFAIKKTFPIISRVSLFFNTNKTYEKTRFNQGSSYKSFN